MSSRYFSNTCAIALSASIQFLIGWKFLESLVSMGFFYDCFIEHFIVFAEVFSTQEKYLTE